MFNLILTKNRAGVGGSRELVVFQQIDTYTKINLTLTFMPTQKVTLNGPKL